MPDPHIAMQAGKTPEIFEEQVCGKILPVGARRDRNRQQQAETVRKRLKGEPGRTRQEQANRKRTEYTTGWKKIGRKKRREQTETAKTERSRNREKDVKKLPAGEINFDGSGILAQ